jgi:hypothetical protein
MRDSAMPGNTSQAPTADVTIVDLPGCGGPATVRIDIHKRSERKPELIRSVYVCEDFEAKALDAIRGAGLLALVGPAKGSTECGRSEVRVVVTCPAKNPQAVA